MKTADFMIIGGGVAGFSAGAGLARHGRTIVLEAESAFGYHSSGRSATFFHFGIGNAPVRGLTAFSRDYFETAVHNGVPVSIPSPALFIARADMVEPLGVLEQDMRHFTDDLEWVDQVGVAALVPVIRCDDDAIVKGLIDRSARRIDSEALQQGYRATLKRHGGESVSGARVVAIVRDAHAWILSTAAGEQFAAPVIVNAAGAWCDEVARLAGVQPLGLRALRRTIIVFDPPADSASRSWPFTKTAVDDFYMLPEAGQLLASPVDEVPSEPTDAQPEEYDVALAAAKVEEYTSIAVRRVRGSWAGLRTFTHDRVPVAGFADDAEGFFWLAGQGGYGLQTAPAMSAATEALITGSGWPPALAKWGVGPDVLCPRRLSSDPTLQRHRI